MKKLTTSLLALLLVMGLCPQEKTKGVEDRVCFLLTDDDGNVLNEEEYLKCLEETGQQGIQPLQGKFPGDDD